MDTLITRRKFFSFFGTGVVLAANPDLLLKKSGITVKLVGPPIVARVPWGPVVSYDIYRLWWEKNQALWRIYR